MVDDGGAWAMERGDSLNCYDNVWSTPNTHRGCGREGWWGGVTEEEIARRREEKGLRKWAF